jgi:mannose-6-phosphate isomerase-like protein (cupin superfamily)
MIYRTDPAAEYYTEERCHIIEILNTAAVADVSVARARVEPGVTTAWHRVTFDELYYILTGTGRMEIEGEETTEIGPGDIARIPAGHAQRITNLTDSDLVFLCICTPRFQEKGYTALES